ncbi:YdeI/OmpD-associated family protein [Thalassococcus sp. CAU 1522]|uniref:YdeI/OmpD-associated family protein n=1 Tax=Thalassococcus arenae TaxID=2851652 RepID=A0ABS6N5B8_9RHOB|nr:YdeI/OmpD-associated family protein [Thalassococcus arenae]MBV2358978.1 YdeI/OmpD-associated family protein [Thalassococcus arenae]
MITEVGDYFARGCGRCDRFDTEDCSTRRWSEGLAALRDLCLGMGLGEQVKWGHPCYRHAGRNIAVMGAFRGDFRLSFFNAALLDDPGGLLERSGPNTRHADVVRFRDTAAMTAQSDDVRALLAQAMAHAEAGRRAPRDAAAPELPEALADMLDADPALADAFAALTPGRQRSFAIHVGGAKQEETRARRAASCRGKILAGKGWTER